MLMKGSRVSPVLKAELFGNVAPEDEESIGAMTGDRRVRCEGVATLGVGVVQLDVATRLCGLIVSLTFPRDCLRCSRSEYGCVEQVEDILSILMRLENNGLGSPPLTRRTKARMWTISNFSIKSVGGSSKASCTWNEIFSGRKSFAGKFSRAMSNPYNFHPLGTISARSRSQFLSFRFVSHTWF